MSRFFKVREAAEQLRITRQSVGQLISSGKLAAHRVGGRYRISEDAIVKFLEDVLVKKEVQNER